MRRPLWIATAILLIIALGAAAFWVTRKPVDSGKTQHSSAANPGKILYWYDPMVPNQHFDKPGKSPFMDMQLVPKYDTPAQAPGSVSIDARTRQLSGIRTAKVTLGELGGTIQAVGYVRPDEHRIEAVQSRSAGWLEVLHVRAVNETVKRGQVLAEIYAPDIYAAEQEYLLMVRHATDANGRALRDAARARLSFLGLSNAQIKALESSGTAPRRMALYAPISGVVTELGAREGMAVSPGANLFSLLDLSRVWVTAEIPEASAGNVTLGSPARVKFPSLPDQTFESRVKAIYPQLETTARSVQIRVPMTNPGGALRPGMLANVTLEPSRRENVVLIPKEALMPTGTRSVVVVMDDTGGFRPVEVETGREAGDKIEIKRGLSAGQTIVVSGQFLLDSESNLQTGLSRLEGDATNAPAEGRPNAEASATRTYAAQGRVTAIDVRQGMVTLAHGPVPGLHWPAMTMGFSVNAEAVRSLKPGAEVRFEFVESGPGKYRITSIHPVAP